MASQLFPCFLEECQVDYTCEKCGMGVTGMKCAKCGKDLVHGTITKNGAEIMTRL